MHKIILIFDYIKFLLNTNNNKGHGIHSPYLYCFIKDIINCKKTNPEFEIIEQQRKNLIYNKKSITYNDLGAGSLLTTTKTKTISDIAKFSLKPKKWAILLNKIVSYYKFENCLELGTSLGITTAYISKAAKNVFTFEGIKPIHNQANEVFNELKITNINLLLGNFDDSLPYFLKTKPKLDFIYIDGNHRYEPTLKYFNLFLDNGSTNKTMFVFDDIYWSNEMKKAWHELKNHSKVTCSIDLFTIGIILIDNSFKEPVHIKIKY